MSRSYASLLSWFALAIGASLMLYHTSDRVAGMDHELRTLNAQIVEQQESLHVLKAEWVYLANPVRIQAEAARHLSLQPTATKRVAALENIATLLPVHNGIEPVPAIQTAQTAPVKTEAPRFKHVASNAAHINERMTLTHTAAAAPTDKIGAMLGTLGNLHP